MDIDKTTYEDLAILSNNDQMGVLQKFDFTRTSSGKHWLRSYFTSPFSDLKHITDTQQILQLILKNEHDWPAGISNGTIMVMERFYETQMDNIPETRDPVNALMFKILHGTDYSITRYSIGHFAEFIKGMHVLIDKFDHDDCPALLRKYLQRAKSLLAQDIIHSLGRKDQKTLYSIVQVVSYGHFIRNRFKHAALELIDIYGRLDAWYSMALATKTFQLVYPSFIEQDEPHLEAVDLYHVLLTEPVSYSIEMQKHSNFLFLTGANMAGKSTFIKAIGVAVYIAHLGMGIPARHMRLSLFDGILSNINVVDNITKGESYFFNEVQRIRDTIIKINDHRKWLVLIDELFKGTNVQDAMKCSSTVIKGLIKIQNSLFILSTHLYEIGEELRSYPNISFKYFETSVNGDQLQFSYQLKDGISNDRLGYLILKREKVVEMLEKL
ncbi:MAG: DNA mismatch repair protein MutS [Chitinophagales bacterium]